MVPVPGPTEPVSPATVARAHAGVRGALAYDLVKPKAAHVAAIAVNSFGQSEQGEVAEASFSDEGTDGFGQEL